MNPNAQLCEQPTTAFRKARGGVQVGFARINGNNSRLELLLNRHAQVGAAGSRLDIKKKCEIAFTAWLAREEMRNAGEAIGFRSFLVVVVEF